MKKKVGQRAFKIVNTSALTLVHVLLHMSLKEFPRFHRGVALIERVFRCDRKLLHLEHLCFTRHMILNLK